MQVYLAIHSNTHVIVVKKRILNSWWGGALAPGAPRVVNQANQWALPGGRMDYDSEEVIAGALREFKEEAGLSLSVSGASSLSVASQNAQYALVQYEVSPTKLQEIFNQITLNTAASVMNAARPAGQDVQDWEWSNPQMVQLANAGNFLGNRQAIPPANQAAVAMRPPHTQSIDWYGAMAGTLASF